MFNKNLKLAASFIAVLAALVVSGCNDFEPNPDPTKSAVTVIENDADASDTVDVGNDSQQPDTQADIAQQDLGNQDTAAPVPDVQQVEVAQEVSAVDAGPKPECAKDTDCDDKNLCTSDICGNGGVCVHLASLVSCDDGNACTNDDVCGADFKCKGTAKDCDDKNPCTDDGCSVDGKCLHGINTVACDDGNACTEKDTCGGGACAGTLKVCDDKNLCTTDTCVVTTGCKFEQVVCNDNDPCTTDVCSQQTGFCSFDQLTCDDGKESTVDWCDWKDGWDPSQGFKCVNAKKWYWCDADKDCQAQWGGGVSDACKPLVCVNNACQQVTKKCEDNNPCTKNVTVSNGDTCSCTFPLDQLPCDDKNVSTLDTCDPIMGCTHTQIQPPPSNTPPSPTLGSNLPSGCGAPWGAWIQLPISASAWTVGIDLIGGQGTGIEYAEPANAQVVLYGSAAAHSTWAWLKPWGTVLPGGIKCYDRCGAIFDPKYTDVAGVHIIAICSTDQK